MAVAASYDTTLRYGAQTPFSDQLTYKWAGGQWQVDSMHDSIITAGNGGVKPTRASFTIFYNEGRDHYDLEHDLKPDEQMWIDVGKLIRDSVPDKTGKTLPADLQSGSYEFQDLVNRGVGALFEGKVIYDKTFGHVSYGCATCCGYSNVNAIFNPLGLGVGDQSLNGVQGVDSCAKVYYNMSGEFDNWSTAAPSVATTTLNGMHTGMSLGTTAATTNGSYIAPGYKWCPQSRAARKRRQRSASQRVCCFIVT